MNKKYDIVVLYSGGLDSKLACKILASQNLSVLAVKFLHPFSPDLMRTKTLHHFDEQLGVDVLEIPTDDDYLETILHPKHGYGANANPCIDCKIYFFKKAFEISRDVGATGIATGEVLGQRPFSQRKDAMELIEKSAGLRGKIVRPLCAKFFKPSQPEIDGIVNRELLYGIRGRGRKEQIELAKKFDIRKYPSPAGGCLLTDPEYSAKFFDAKEHGEITFETTQLLKFGRHFRFRGRRIVIGRNRRENEIFEKIFLNNRFLIVPSVKGPSALVDVADDEILRFAASLVARYCRTQVNNYVEVRVFRKNSFVRSLKVAPADPIYAEKFLIRKIDKS